MIFGLRDFIPSLFHSGLLSSQQLSFYLPCMLQSCWCSGRNTNDSSTEQKQPWALGPSAYKSGEIRSLCCSRWVRLAVNRKVVDLSPPRNQGLFFFKLETANEDLMKHSQYSIVAFGAIQGVLSRFSTTKKSSFSFNIQRSCSLLTFLNILLHFASGSND